jgi:hypothetical protein
MSAVPRVSASSAGGSPSSGDSTAGGVCRTGSVSGCEKPYATRPPAESRPIATAICTTFERVAELDVARGFDTWLLLWCRAQPKVQSTRNENCCAPTLPRLRAFRRKRGSNRAASEDYVAKRGCPVPRQLAPRHPARRLSTSCDVGVALSRRARTQPREHLPPAKSARAMWCPLPEGMSWCLASEWPVPVAATR